MKVLVIEDDRKIKTERIDDCLISLGHESDWAQNQQEANALLADNDYDLILLDLQIPSRKGGTPLAEFGKHQLKQIRASKGRNVPVILMTAQWQHCVDLMGELQDIGIDGSIAKPFPETGRTLAVVIEEVMDKHRRFRAVAKKKDEPLTPFAGGVLAFYPSHVDLCGETIASKSQKGYAWRILHLLREDTDWGSRVRMDSTKLARKLHPNLAQNTLIRAIKTLRDRITTTMEKRLRCECGPDDVVGNGGDGYHLRDWITIEQYDDVGTLAGCAAEKATRGPKAPEADRRFGERQRWVLAQLASGVKLTRRDVEREFDVGPRTAKRELGELSEAGMIEFDRGEYPGHYRLR